MNNVILDCLIKYSKTNIPIMILESMHGEVKNIWAASGRNNFVEINADDFCFSDVAVFAQENIYDAIEIRSVEKLSDDFQTRLAHLLSKLDAKDRGKFILTAESFDSLNPQLLKLLCKVDFRFPGNRSKDGQINYSEIGYSEEKYEYTN